MKDEEVVTNPTVVASLFNNYFTDIAKILELRIHLIMMIMFHHI